MEAGRSVLRNLPGGFQFTFAFSLGQCSFANDVFSSLFLPRPARLSPTTLAHLICDHGKKRQQESSKMRNQCELDIGKKIHEEGDIYYRWLRNYRPSCYSVLRHSENDPRYEIIGDPLRVFRETIGRPNSFRRAHSVILIANKGLKISMSIMVLDFEAKRFTKLEKII